MSPGRGPPQATAGPGRRLSSRHYGRIPPCRRNHHGVYQRLGDDAARRGDPEGTRRRVRVQDRLGPPHAGPPLRVRPSAQGRGLKVIIAGAGARPTCRACARQDHAPVLGVPVESKALHGWTLPFHRADARRVPVGTLAIGKGGGQRGPARRGHRRPPPRADAQGPHALPQQADAERAQPPRPAPRDRLAHPRSRRLTTVRAQDFLRSGVSACVGVLGGVSSSACSRSRASRWASGSGSSTPIPTLPEGTRANSSRPTRTGCGSGRLRPGPRRDHLRVRERPRERRRVLRRTARSSSRRPGAGSLPGPSAGNSCFKKVGSRHAAVCGGQFGLRGARSRSRRRSARPACSRRAAWATTEGPGGHPRPRPGRGGLRAGRGSGAVAVAHRRVVRAVPAGELSLICVRGAPARLEPRTRFYPLVENHHAGACCADRSRPRRACPRRSSRGPAPGPAPARRDGLRRRADDRTLRDRDKDEGGWRRCWATRMARVHNSGHWTIEGRDEPVREPPARPCWAGRRARRSCEGLPHAAMLNLLRALPHRPTAASRPCGCTRTCTPRGTETRRRAQVGHVTIVSPSAAALGASRSRAQEPGPERLSRRRHATPRGVLPFSIAAIFRTRAARRPALEVRRQEDVDDLLDQRCPSRSADMHSTFASLCERAISAVSSSCTSAARPLTLFAAMHCRCPTRRPGCPGRPACSTPPCRPGTPARGSRTSRPSCCRRPSRRAPGP